jgi:hypothetical protein
VPPEPGDRTSSLPGPGYDSEEEGGLCKKDEALLIHKHKTYTKKQQFRAKLGTQRNAVHELR